MLRRLPSLSLTLLALVALLGAGATAVAAGGMAVITVTDVPADPPAGEETTIGFTVMQHGVTAVSWPHITLVATDAATRTVIRAEARPEGRIGSYVATVTFPAAGDWTLTFDSTDLMMEGSAVLQVAPGVAAAPAAAPPAAAPPAAEPVTAAQAAPTPDTTPALIALLVGVLLLGAGLTLRSRRERTQTTVTART